MKVEIRKHITIFKDLLFMKKLYAIFIIVFIISCKNESQEDSLIIDTKAGNASFIETKTGETVINNNYFQSFQYQENENIKTQILHIKQIEVVSEKSLISKSEMQISNQNATWKVDSKAHELSIRNNTLVAKTNADSDHEDTYSLFNIETGAHLLDYSYNCLTARIPQSNFKRYIGFVARSNSNDLLKKYGDDVIGILSYASENKLLESYIVKSKKDVNRTSPSIELVALNEEQAIYENNMLLYFMDLDHNYKAEDINFAFALKFYIGEQVKESAMLFEVENDKIELKNAKFDSEVFQIKAL